MQRVQWSSWPTAASHRSEGRTPPPCRAAQMCYHGRPRRRACLGARRSRASSVGLSCLPAASMKRPAGRTAPPC
eukprot:scaffold2018_cov56-Phaeocystis_antarctica.AAC.1